MQYKKALILFIISVIILTSHLVLVGAQDNPALVSVLPSNPQVTTGQEFTVSIQIANAVQIYGASFELSYDPQSFEVIPSNGSASVAAGPFFEGKPSFTLKNTADPTKGSVVFAITLMQPAEPVSGEGTLGIVTFRALKDGNPATISAMKADLVSPVYADVNGQKVAESMRQVPAQIIQAMPGAASAGTRPIVQGNTANTNQIPVVAAGAFFLIGSILFIVSIGLFSRTRSFNRMTLKDVQPEAY
jgi:hypothetical protein